jgi:hypothetical protein
VLIAPAGFGRIHLAEAASIPGVRNVVQAALPLALSSRFAVTAGFRTMVTNGNRPDREVVERVISRGGLLVEGAREGTRAVVHAGRDKDAFHRRRVGYDGPVLAVWGDRDRLVPVSHRHGVKTAFPQAQIQVWYGMGHHPLSERFDKLLAMIKTASTAAHRPTRRKIAPATVREVTFRQRPSARVRVSPGGHGRLVVLGLPASTTVAARRPTPRSSQLLSCDASASTVADGRPSLSLGLASETGAKPIPRAARELAMP